MLMSGPEYEGFATRVNVAPLEIALNEDAPGRACNDQQEFFRRNLEIQEVLPVAGLAHVVPFNEVYSRMTHRVLDYLDDEKFELPEWVEINMPSFGEKYHDDLRLYINYVKTGDKAEIAKMNPAWAQVFFDKRMRNPNTPKSLKVLAGVNAHIESEDLAVSMAEVDTPNKYYSDFLLIDQAISEVIHKHLPEYLPMNGNGARFSAHALSRRIVAMRADAWEKSREIRQHLHQGKDTQHPDIQSITDRMNRRTVMHNKAILFGAPAVNVFMNQWAQVAPNKHLPAKF